MPFIASCSLSRSVIMLYLLRRLSAANSFSFERSSLCPLEPLAGLLPFFAWWLARGLWAARRFSSLLMLRREERVWGINFCSRNRKVSILYSLCSRMRDPICSLSFMAWVRYGRLCYTPWKYSSKNTTVLSWRTAQWSRTRSVRNSSSHVVIKFSPDLCSLKLCINYSRNTSNMTCLGTSSCSRNTVLKLRRIISVDT